MGTVCRAWPVEEAPPSGPHDAPSRMQQPQQQACRRTNSALEHTQNLPTFEEFSDKRLVAIDMSHFAMRLAIGLAAFMKFGSQYQPWDRAVVSCCGIALASCFAWAGISPSTYARWRSCALGPLRVAIQAQPIISLVVVGIMNNADPWQYGGTAGGALFWLLFTLCSGSLGAVQWALAARLPLLLHAVAQAGVLWLELSRLPSFCGCQVMQQPQSRAAVRRAYSLLERLSSPWVWGFGHTRGSAALGPQAQCWAVAALVLVWLGFVLPAVVVAVWECEEFHKFRAVTGGRHLSGWRTWLYERTAAAPVEGGWVRGGKLALMCWPLVGVVWDLVKTMA